jgi:hypothetical protein
MSRSKRGASYKIKSDWLDYMHLMEQKETSNLPSSETDNEKKREAYEEV